MGGATIKPSDQLRRKEISAERFEKVNLDSSLVTIATGLVLVAALSPRFLTILFFAFSLTILFAALSMLFERKLDRMCVPVLVLFGYFLLSGLLTEAIAFGDLVNISFYEGEGRLFISYVPFILFCFFSTSAIHLRQALKLSYAICLLSLACVPVWYLGVDGGLLGDYRYLMLQTHHTGAGTIFGLLAILMILSAQHLREFKYGVVGILMLIPIFLTTSRQALLSVAVAALIILMIRFKRYLIPFIVILSFSPLFISKLSPVAYDRIDQLFAENTLQNIKAQIKVANWRPEQNMEDFVVGDEWNILARFLFYSRAINLFVDSPFVGAGFGRYNDYYVKFDGIEGLAYWGMGGEKVFDTKSAHNSYLHLLSEGGLIAIIIVSWFWWLIFSRLIRARKSFLSNENHYGLLMSEASIFMIIVVLIGSMFGHALATPSFMLFLLTYISITLRQKDLHLTRPAEV